MSTEKKASYTLYLGTAPMVYGSGNIVIGGVLFLAETFI